MAKKASAVEAAAVSGDREALLAAREEWEEAAAEYASTNEGHAHLSAQAETTEAAGDMNTSALLKTVVRRGEALRAANQETASLLAAVRLAQEPASSAPVAPRSAELAVVDTGPVVPDLSAEEREQWVAALASFDEIAPDIESVYIGVYGSSSGDEIKDDLRTVDTVLGDPHVEDKALAQQVRILSNHRSMRFTMPHWKGEREGTLSDEQNRLNRKRWQELIQPLTGALESQVRRALGHPNADIETYIAAHDEGIVKSRVLTSRPDAPAGYLKHAIKDDPTPDDLHPTGLNRAREVAFNDAGMAMLLAAHDPDSFHRNEAMNKVMTASFDTMSEDERTWLATNLPRLPGSDESHRILAVSIRSWATGYADRAERKNLGTILSESEVPSVAEVGRSLLDADASATPVQAPPARRGWFR